MKLDQIWIILIKFRAILMNFEIMIFGKFLWQNWKNVGMQNLLQNHKIWLFFNEFHCDFNFLVHKFSKFVTFLIKSWFSDCKILWSSCQNCVTSLMSFSPPNDRHTLSNFTIRKISLSWYDFVKEMCLNSSYRFPKRRNEVGTRNFVKISISFSRHEPPRRESVAT